MIVCVHARKRSAVRAREGFGSSVSQQKNKTEHEEHSTEP